MLHDHWRAVLEAARARRDARNNPAPPPPPPPTGPDDRQFHADTDEDGDDDHVHSFDVTEHTIPDVKAHVESHPGSEAHVLECELASASPRSTLIDWLNARLV